MPEAQKPSTGWNGEVWLSTDNTTENLKELVQVVSFSLPSDTVERVQTTHLKSPGRRHEYTSGMIDGGEVEVVLNFRPGSDTDDLIEAALASGDPRTVRFNVPELGVLTRSYTTTAQVLGYDKGSIEVDGKMEATMTLAISGAVTRSAYTPPA